MTIWQRASLATLLLVPRLLAAQAAAGSGGGDDFDDVHFHLLHTAKQEWAAFNRTVTDWERRRNFDQW